MDEKTRVQNIMHLGFFIGGGGGRNKMYQEKFLKIAIAASMIYCCQGNGSGS